MAFAIYSFFFPYLLHLIDEVLCYTVHLELHNVVYYDFYNILLPAKKDRFLRD